jgi:hypothetical protein
VAFEIEGEVIRALYVVRNPDKLRHLAAPSTPHESVPHEQGVDSSSRNAPRETWGSVDIGDDQAHDRASAQRLAPLPSRGNAAR